MPRGLFQMGTLGWTPAAQLATQNQEGPRVPMPRWTKAVNQTQTTKVSGEAVISSGIFFLSSARLRGLHSEERIPWREWHSGSTLGGGIGSAIGGQSAATLGGLGTFAAESPPICRAEVR